MDFRMICRRCLFPLIAHSIRLWAYLKSIFPRTPTTPTVTLHCMSALSLLTCSMSMLSGSAIQFFQWWNIMCCDIYWRNDRIWIWLILLRASWKRKECWIPPKICNSCRLHNHYWINWASFLSVNRLSLQHLVCQCIFFNRSRLFKNLQETQSLKNWRSTFCYLWWTSLQHLTLVGSNDLLVSFKSVKTNSRVDRRTDALEFYRVVFWTLKT